MMKRITLFLATAFCVANLSAQIGYQVSLLNTATGVPRANETVTCLIELSNTDGVFYTQTQTVTTNDFGVLSLQIGNETTFQSTDATKLPLFVSVTVDGTLVGKSQILSVPLAENLRPFATGNDLFRTWSYRRGIATHTLSLNQNYSFSLTDAEDGYGSNTISGNFFVVGNLIFLCANSQEESQILGYCNGKLYSTGNTFDGGIYE